MSTFGATPGEQQDVRLTEQERQLVARLLSDPTYFPVEFRSWLKNYIESAGITVSAGQIISGGAVRTGMPPGLFISCGSVAAVPPDALVCDGRAVNRATYAQLYAKIGTKWGPGDGTTSFNLPDLRDRTPFGVGAVVGEGATDSQAYGSRTGPNHRHTVNDPGHSHRPAHTGNTFVSYGSGTGTDPGSDTGTRWSIGDDNRTEPVGTGISVGPGGGNLEGPNWAGVVYAITTGQNA